MSMFIVKDTSNGNTRECDSMAEAKETKNDMVALGADPTNLEIIPPGEGDNTAKDADEMLAEETGRPKEEFEAPEDYDYPEPDGGAVEPSTQQVPDDPSVDEDPVDWMPEHFIDKIQGVPTVNRKGYAVIAAQYGVSVEAKPITLPSDTDFEYAEFRAVATTEDGQTYSGFGSAHVDRQDGDDKHILAELAETRAMKRATAWATGVGMTAIEELQGNL